MNIVDIIIIIVLVLCTLLGLKKGVIKGFVQLIGTVAVVILAYTFKGIIANFLIDYLPFFNFIGYVGITSINVLVYELLSFVLIFVLLYCILNIIISISGLVDTLIKYTVVLALPSRILGAIVGLLDGIVFAFLILFIMLHLGPTEKYVMDSKMGIVILERTPFVGAVMAKTTLALEEINDTVNAMEEGDNVEAANAYVLQILIHRMIVTREEATKFIEDGKVDLENVTFS